MAYINTTDNENRYRELCSKYGDAVRQRNARISAKKATVEVREAALQEIENAINELNATNKITHELAQERGRLWTARTRAIERLREAKKELAAAQVGDEGMAEFNRIMQNR
jgi:recombinational DNA repair ATPase RecF